MDEAHIDIVGYSADDGGLRLVAHQRDGEESTPGVIVIPLAQLETLLDAVALGMRFRKIIGQA